MCFQHPSCCNEKLELFFIIKMMNSCNRQNDIEMRTGYIFESAVRLYDIPLFQRLRNNKISKR